MLIVVSLLAACGSGEGVSERLPRSPVAFATQISINEVMVAQIDDVSYFIREAANPEIEVRWQEVEHRAVALIASGSAMTMGGAGVNDAMWVTQPGWRDFVGKMNAALVQALNAVRDRNLIALGSAEDNLVGACESCHPQYKSSIPSMPTEG